MLTQTQRENFTSLRWICHKLDKVGIKNLQNHISDEYDREFLKFLSYLYDVTNNKPDFTLPSKEILELTQLSVTSEKLNKYRLAELIQDAMTELGYFAET